MLPELGEYQRDFDGKLRSLGYLENHVHIVAMLGFALFYGLEQLAKSSKRHNKKDGEHKATVGVFWLHIGSFALYNATMEYLLLRGEYQTEWGMVFYFLAMGVHFVTNDKGLRATHKEDYDRYWMLVARRFDYSWMAGRCLYRGE
ncbi:hypothetical protein ABZ756_08980 [Mammaliicoccus sciuri]